MVVADSLNQEALARITDNGRRTGVATLSKCSQREVNLSPPLGGFASPWHCQPLGQDGANLLLEEVVVRKSKFHCT